jgi:hypothetical protein
MATRKHNSPANLLRGFPASGETGVERLEGGGGFAISGAGVNMFRFRALLGGLHLEIKIGMQMTRGRSAYSILKEELDLRGSKQKVYDQALAIFNRLYPKPESAPDE